MNEHLEFDDGRGQFPETLTVRVPYGFTDKVRRAAKKNGLKFSEEARRRLSAWNDVEEGREDHSEKARSPSDALRP